MCWYWISYSVYILALSTTETVNTCMWICDNIKTLTNSVLYSSITTEGERMRGGVIMTEGEMSPPLR